MAELFQYTSTQRVAGTSVPNIQVTPNLQAARAFESMGNLVKAAQQERLQQVQREKSLLSAQAQLQEAQAAEATAAAKTMEESRKRAASAEAMGFNTDFSNRINLLNEGLINAGDDIQARRELYSTFREEDLAVYNSLPTDVQEKVYKARLDTLESTHKSFMTKDNEILGVEFKNMVGESLPLFVKQDLAQQIETYQTLQAQAGELNISKAVFGEDFAKMVGDYMIASADVEQMINTLDYQSVYDMENAVKLVAEIDPKTKRHVEAAVGKIQSQLKDKLDSHVNSMVTQSIQTNDYNSFVAFRSIGLAHGAISQQEGYSQTVEFQQKAAASGHVARQNATALHQTTPFYPTGLLTGKMKEAKVSLVKQDFTTQVNKDQMDIGYVKQQLNNNAKIVAPILKETINRQLNNVMAYAVRDDKDPEVQQQNQVQMLGRLAHLSNLTAVAGIHIDAKMREQIQFAQILAMTPDIKNRMLAKEAFDAHSGEIMLHSGNKHMKALKEELPDQYLDAQRYMSALAVTGQLSEEDAYEAAKRVYNYEELDGVDFKVSGNIKEDLLGAGLSEDSFNLFQDMLLSDEADVLPEEARTAISNVLEGTNAKVRRLHGSMLFVNDEGASAILPLTKAQLTLVADNVMKKKASLDKPHGIEVVVDELASHSAVSASEMTDTVVARAKGTVAPLVMAGKLGVESMDSLFDTVKNYPEHINNLIDDVYVQGQDFSQAWDTFTGKTSADLKAAGKEAAVDVEAVMTEYHATIEAMKATGPQEGPILPDKFELNTNLDAIKGAVKNALDGIMVFMADKGDEVLSPEDTQLLDDLLQREAPRKKGILQIEEGHIHYDDAATKKNPTTNYGVVTDNFPKNEGETDREHALRVFNDHFRPKIEALNIKGVPTQRLALLAWNIGPDHQIFKDMKGLDLSKPQDQEKARGAITKIVTAGGKWMRGLVSARAKDWNRVAEVIEPSKEIVEYEIFKGDTPDTYYRTFFFRDGSQETFQMKMAQHSDSKTTLNKRYRVQ